MKLELHSPAKINFFLRIVGKRSDGYHELASYFQAIDLCDQLSFESGKSGISCSDPSVPCDERNTVVKAIKLFCKKVGVSSDVRVHIEKNIPPQAGLGGGSSNGATTLWAMNQLHGKPLNNQQLQQLASEIGSDMPFFFSSGSAFCTGRGEFVESIKMPPWLQTTPIHLFSPPFGNSTAEIYSKFHLRDQSTLDPKELLESWINCMPIYVNDLEKPAMEVSPQLSNLKKQIQLAFSNDSPTRKKNHIVGMTGSGSSLFALGDGDTSNITAVKKYQAKAVSRSQENWFFC